MSEYTKDEALAFVDAIRLSLHGKVGFKWHVERLSLLADYIRSISAENERLNDYLEWANARGDFETYLATRDDAARE